MNYPMEAEVEGVHAGFHQWQWQRQWRLLALLSSPTLSPATAAMMRQPRRQPNHVRWEETAAAHLFSANLPGLRKEEVRVEVEDARYLVIRTELLDADADADVDRASTRRSFARKFRLPGMVDADGVSAEYAHGVLTVTVPRMHTRLRPAAAVGAAQDSAAPAA